jgi:hypothetical protein
MLSLVTDNWISGSKTLLLAVTLMGGDSSGVQQNGGLIKPSTETSTMTHAEEQRHYVALRGVITI